MVSPEQFAAPSNIDFATEVKTDRLALLWKVTLGGALSVLFMALSVTGFADISLVTWVVAPAVLAAGCLLTQHLLKGQHFTLAAWAYTIGGLGAVSVALCTPEYLGRTNILVMGVTEQIVPFVFVVIVFMVGLLLNPRDTFIVATISALLTILIPATKSESFSFLSDGHQIFAIALMYLSAILAAQVTGELYAVTEWALLNYQRERRTNFDLFESRLELQKSLKRAEALSDKLKETNAELAVAHAAAEAAKNFRGQFLANMSHELRTPLNAIIGFSETMLKFPIMYDDVPLPTPYNRDMNQIHTSGRQLLNLINDILDLARVDAGKLEIYMQRVNPDTIIRDVVSITRGLIGNKPIELVTDVPDPVPLVTGDEVRLKQVLLNLTSNAAKFTDKGMIKLSVRPVADGVQFSLRDTGIGIHPDQLEFIFQEFQQANTAGRDPRSGAGLGLAISRQLVQLMGGRIWAESEPGKGSTFHFVLPAYDKDRLITGEAPTVTLVPSTPSPGTKTEEVK